MSYYVTLSSHTQSGEFPNNTSSDFRLRLPENKKFHEEDEWEVGLSGVSFPDPPTKPVPIPEHSENLLVHPAYSDNERVWGTTHPEAWNQEGYLCTFYCTTLLNGSINRNLRNVVTLNDITPSKTGVEFVKKIIHAMEQKIALSLRTGEVLTYTWTDSEGVTHTKKTVATFKWDGDDLILDNSEVFISGVMWKYFGWTFELALNMRWLQLRSGMSAASNLRYYKGPYMHMVAVDPKGPWADYTQERFHETTFFSGSPNSFANGPVNIVREGTGWTSVDQGALFMIMAKAFNWRFVHLNEAFDRFKHTPVALQAVERPLFVTIDLIESGWVNNVYDEMLRTVPYKHGNLWWEPRHVLYHDHRGHGIVMAHIRVKEMNGSEVVFGSGVMRICLHFRKKRHGCRRPSSEEMYINTSDRKKERDHVVLSDVIE